MSLSPIHTIPQLPISSFAIPLAIWAAALLFVVAPAARCAPPEGYVDLVVNGGFETDAIQEPPGYTGNVAEWMPCNAHGHILNDKTGPFYTAALGPIPRGDQLYAKQGAGELSQSLVGLQDGEAFHFHCRANCREGDAGMELTIKLGAQLLWAGVVETHRGNFQEITHKGIYSDDWGDTLTFTFANPRGDATVLVDDIQLWTRPVYAVSYHADPVVGGHVSGPETIEPGDAITVVVAPTDGFSLDTVTASNGSVSRVSDSEFTLSNVAGGNASVFAHFLSDAPTPAVPIILDTDMESDVDDVGALAMLHALADRGALDILGVMVSALNPASAACAERINRYFGRPNIPIGNVRGDAVMRDSRYAAHIAAEFPGALESGDAAPDATALYRRILAGQPDNSVVIVTIGYKTNMRNLLRSDACEHSDLAGRALVARKVRLWMCMGGRFPSGREANILWDARASHEAITDWPTDIIFSGWEIGRDIYTGGRLAELPVDSPVRRSYQLFNNLRPHRSWDQAALLYAGRALYGGTASDYWELSPPGRIVINPEDGSNRWEDDPTGTHRHKRVKMEPDRVAAELDVLMMQQP